MNDWAKWSQVTSPPLLRMASISCSRMAVSSVPTPLKSVTPWGPYVSAICW